MNPPRPHDTNDSYKAGVRLMEPIVQCYTFIKSWLVLGNGVCVRPSMLPSEINARVENSFGAMLFVRICTHFMPEAFWSSHWALGRGFLWPEAF